MRLRKNAVYLFAVDHRWKNRGQMPIFEAPLPKSLTLFHFIDLKHQKSS